MECTAKITRERKSLRGAGMSKSKTEILIYCPIVGEIYLEGDRAEEARRRLEEAARTR